MEGIYITIGCSKNPKFKNRAFLLGFLESKFIQKCLMSQLI